MTDRVIVGVYNFVTHPDTHTRETRDYIVMEYVSGLPLSAVAHDAQHGTTRLSEPLLTEHLITCVLRVSPRWSTCTGGTCCTATSSRRT